MTQLTQETDKSETSLSETKRVPTIYLHTSHISAEVNEILDGLHHLNVKVLNAEDMSLEKALKEAKIMAVLSDDLDVIKKAWENGVVTITKKFHPSIEDYDPNSEKGNAFVYENMNKWEVFAAVVRAVETYKFPYDWNYIVRSCKGSTS